MGEGFKQQGRDVDALTSRKVSGRGEKEGVFSCSAAALVTGRSRIKGRLVNQENKVLDMR